VLAQPARCRFNDGLHNYTLYRVFLDDRIKDNELGGHVAYVGWREIRTKFWLENLKGRKTQKTWTWMGG
jgi:hypothetical protein